MKEGRHLNGKFSKICYAEGGSFNQDMSWIKGVAAKNAPNMQSECQKSVGTRLFWKSSSFLVVNCYSGILDDFWGIEIQVTESNFQLFIQKCASSAKLMHFQEFSKKLANIKKLSRNMRWFRQIWLKYVLHINATHYWC